MTLRFRVIATFTAMFMSALPTGINAELIHDACEAFQRGDYIEAIRLYRSLANRGNSFAQNNLGIIYDVGLGVPVNHAKAAFLY